jgi:hypothetical protein
MQGAEAQDLGDRVSIRSGNPLNIAFFEHETIYILYNSPTVTPQAFTNWPNGE